MSKLIIPVIKYFVEHITESILELKDATPYDADQFAYGEKTAYVECLEIFKHYLENPEEYGLDFEIEEKFPL